MKKLIGYFMLLCFSLIAVSIQAQPDIASSNLRYKMNNTSFKTESTDMPANQDKNNLTKMGTRICITVDGEPTQAMITGGGGTVWGPNKDSYNVTITDGPKSRQKVFIKPNEISSVGECPETYIPIPNTIVPDGFNVRQLELDIIKEVNILRANPKAYADEMAKLEFKKFGRKRNRFQSVVLGTDDVMWSCDADDEKCVKEYKKKMKVAIDYLRNFKEKLEPLTENSALAKGSEMLAADQGKIDGPGHKDSRGRGAYDRAVAGGYYKSGWRGEVLNAGHISAAGFVVSFLTSPGHRDILLKKDINEIGVDIHKHGSGEEAYLRDVINVGRSESQASNDPAPSKVKRDPSVSNPTQPTAPTPSDPGGTAGTATSSLSGGQKLSEGERMYCPNKSYYMVMQRDGNCVIYTSKGDRFVWGTMTTSGSGCRMDMQTDGNLVVYDRNNKAVWSSKTHPYFDRKFSSSDWKPVRCGLENDGTLALYSASGKKVWTSSSSAQNDDVAVESNIGSELKAGGKLSEGQRMYCTNKSHYMVMQRDGNCVVYKTQGDRFVWGTMTTSGSGCRLDMQSDGNLVVYDRNNKAVWSSKTHPYFDRKFSSSDWKPVRCGLENDGTLALYNASGKQVWTSSASSSSTSTESVVNASMFDANKYYRLTCQWQGEGKSLDVVNDGKNNNQLQLANTGKYSGQAWKIKSLGDGYYRLTTSWQGEGKSLDVVNDGKNNNQLQLAKSGELSGQAWKITPLGNGYYRLTCQWQGEGKSLDVVNDGKNNKLQLAKTGEYSGQAWKITEYK